MRCSNKNIKLNLAALYVVLRNVKCKKGYSGVAKAPALTCYCSVAVFIGIGSIGNAGGSYKEHFSRFVVNIRIYICKSVGKNSVFVNKLKLYIVYCFAITSHYIFLLGSAVYNVCLAVSFNIAFALRERVKGVFNLILALFAPGVHNACFVNDCIINSLFNIL